MTLNEILTKQTILNALLLKEGENELNKELKVKIVRLRIAYNKITRQFEEDVEEFKKNLITDEFTKLQSIPEQDRTKEDSKKLEDLNNQLNSEFNEFLKQKGIEEIKLSTDDSFTEEDFDEIISVNAGNKTVVNNTSIKAEDLMDGFYTLFVNKN